MRFLGARIRKQYICQADFHADLPVSPYFLSILRDKTFDRGKENLGDFFFNIPFRLFEKFPPKVQAEALTR